MNKADLRKQGLETRNKLSQEKVDQKSTSIQIRLESLKEFKEGSHILFYYSVNNEVKTIPIIEKHQSTKSISLPKLVGDFEMEAVIINSFSEMNRNKEGIPEPPNENKTEETLDLIIIPGVIFDKQGRRIGMGKGYYDRFLKRHPAATKIALAYEEQVLDSIPKDPYDVDADIIVTDQNIYRCCPAL